MQWRYARPMRGICMSWAPEQYLKFADQRRRPAIDLLTRIGLASPARIYDLGCGAGNVTKLLAERWPAARITGVDSSQTMLDKARAETPKIEWVEADLAQWMPDAPPDLIYSNAALHWLDDHRRLFAKLFRSLAPGGALAVQMPRNHQAPSHTGMAAAARSGSWRATLESVLRESPVLPPADYYDILAAEGVRADIW